ncbi:MAG: hypothetical protein MJ231_05625 [bacterium]|nr:hypothetical protein [bacterium]
MSMTPIDSSISAALIDSIGTHPSRASLSQIVPAVNPEGFDTSEPIDLSGYFENIANYDIFQEVANNVAQSGKALDNAIIAALENGFGIEDAVNFNCALQAYKANCAVAQSTFELKI